MSNTNTLELAPAPEGEPSDRRHIMHELGALSMDGVHTLQPEDSQSYLTKLTEQQVAKIEDRNEQLDTPIKVYSLDTIRPTIIRKALLEPQVPHAKRTAQPSRGGRDLRANAPAVAGHKKQR